MSNNKKKALIVGAGGLALAVGVGAYIYSQSSNKRDRLIVDAQIDRATIIRVLKELKKEMFTVFQNFSAVSMNIKQQSMGRAKPEEIKMMLLEQPMFRGEIDNVEESVYSSHGLSKHQVQHLCENVYREDPQNFLIDSTVKIFREIKELQKQMKIAFDNSFLGIAPDSKTDIPEFLTANKTFEILEKVMLESAIALNGKLLELQEQGEQINFNNPKMMEIMSSLKMDNSKKEILKQYGLDQFEEPGPKILQHATQTYTKENRDGFSDKLSKLDVKYQQIMEQILMGGPISPEELKDQMNKDVQAQPFMGMGGFGGMRGPPPQRQQQPQQPKNGSQKEVQKEQEDEQKEEVKQEEANENQEVPKQDQEANHQEKHEEAKEVHHEEEHHNNDQHEQHNDAPQEVHHKNQEHNDQHDEMPEY